MSNRRFVKITIPAIMLLSLLLLYACGDDPVGPGKDTTPPTIESVFPADGNQSAAVTSDITVTFSEEVATSTLAAAFSIVPATDGSMIYANRQMRFTPTANLLEDTTFTVQIDSTVTDEAGNKLAAPYIWQFGTNNPPSVVSTTPWNGAEQVQTGSRIAVVFSEKIDTLSLPTTPISFVPAIAGTISFDSTIMYFTPSTKMSRGQNYVATVAAGFSDMKGNLSTSPQTWLFSTASDNIVSPTNEAVVDDQVTIEVATSDTGSVDRVELTIDGTPFAGGPDDSYPYAFSWDAGSEALGSAHQLAVMSYDTSGALDWTDTITVHYLWRLLIADDSLESDIIGIIPRDLQNIYIRSTATQLQFRVETTRGWNVYWSPSEGIDVAVFIDTDQNPATGRTTSGSYNINDIGAEFRCIVGLHGDSVRYWFDPNWVPVGSGRFDDLIIDDSTNFFEFGVNLNRLGLPSAIDVVVANVTNQEQEPPGRWDWAPNQGEGHASYIIDHSYTGTLTSANKLRRQYGTNRSVAWPTPFD